jgi:hypothetical protein
VIAASAGSDPSLPLARREKQREQYAHQAVALLRRAAAAGLFRGPAGVTDLNKDDKLAILRDRDDYRAFVRSLPAPAPSR